jgi:hypothetical protein
MRLALTAGAVGTLLLFSGYINAQGLSTIVGTVTDPSGGVVPTARITIAQERTSIAQTLSTDAQGYYVVPSLRPTSYTLTVEAAGFRKYSQADIILLADQSLTLNIKLELGEASQTVSVSAAGAQVDIYTPTLKEVVDEKRIVELPLNGRNAASLTTLVAGVVVDTSGNNDDDQGSTKTFPAGYYDFNERFATEPSQLSARRGQQR